jgi:hypothetical protein
MPGMRRTLLALALSAALPASAAAQETKIQPGASHGGFCTFNFIFDGLGANLGKVYIGTAAHCVEKVGEPAAIGDEPPFGKVAFIHDAELAETDYAFVEVDPAHVDRVDPALKGHPEIPSGFTVPDETAAGDIIQMSGYGIGFGETQPTQEQRQVVLQSDDEQLYTLSGPSVNGDSGGPFVHVKTSKALGIVSRYGFDTASTDTGPTVQGILAKAAAKKFPVQFRPVGGEPPAGPAQPSSQPQPQPAATATPTPTPTPATKAPAKKKKKKLSCTAKAKKVKNAKKRRAALKRCKKAKRR